MFVSSIAVVGIYKEPGGAHESSVADAEHASLGYGQAKLVGERLCERASREFGLDVMILRIGQLSSVYRVHIYQISLNE